MRPETIDFADNMPVPSLLTRANKNRRKFKYHNSIRILTVRVLFFCLSQNN